MNIVPSGYNDKCGALVSVLSIQPSSGGVPEFLLDRAERSEGAFGLGLVHPVVDARQVDVLPDLRRDMADHNIGQDVPFGPQALDDAREINGVPQDDGTDHQIEAGSAESLALEGAVADFAALMKKTRPGSACCRPRPCSGQPGTARAMLGWNTIRS